MKYLLPLLFLPCIAFSQINEIYVGAGLSTATHNADLNEYFDTYPVEHAQSNFLPAITLAVYDNIVSDRLQLGLQVSATNLKPAKYYNAVAHFLLNMKLAQFGNNAIYLGPRAGVGYTLKSQGNKKDQNLHFSVGGQLNYTYNINTRLALSLDNLIYSTALEYGPVKKGSFIIQSTVGIKLRF